MAQPRCNHESFASHHTDADVIPIHSRAGKESIAAEQSPTRFHLMKWLKLSSNGTAVADIILNDVSADTDDEKQTALKAALKPSVLYDYYDALHEYDSIIPLLEQRARTLVKSSDGMTSERRALIALMEVRAAEIIESPEQDIPLQLTRLPLGDEKYWQQLIDELKE